MYNSLPEPQIPPTNPVAPEPLDEEPIHSSLSPKMRLALAVAAVVAIGVVMTLTLIVAVSIGLNR